MSNAGARSFDCDPTSEAPSAGRPGASLIAAILRHALPQRCELCAARTGGTILCDRCMAALPRAGAVCPRCALPSTQGALCGACLADPPPFAATSAAFLYAFPVDRLIHALKYGRHTALAVWAGAALASVARAQLGRTSPAERARSIVALPLSNARQRERGFNQAALIAARVARATSLPVATPLARPGGGAAQTALPWRERRRNVRGVFAVRSDVRGARIALVDDVMTTGATLAEATRALLGAGAARVECWVLARTPSPDDR